MNSYIINTQDQLDNVLSVLKNYKVQDKSELSIRPYKKTRSQAQNRLYWRWMTILSFETGHTKDELHEFFKHKLLGSEFKNVFGAETLIANSTTDLRVADFASYLTQIEVFALTKGIILPHTEDYATSMGAE